MMKTMNGIVAGCIAMLSAVIMPAIANAAEASDKWFSIVSVLHHDEAFSGAHDVELCGDDSI